MGSCAGDECNNRYPRAPILLIQNNYSRPFQPLPIVFSEHRYFGKSLPFGDKSLDAPEYSGFLSPEQALADVADLLTKRVNIEQRPVITFGGSYGGLLSAWFRMKYPHLTTGAIASSAPMLQFTTDCQTFRQLTTAVFTTAHANCSRNIKKAWPIIEYVDGKFLAFETNRLNSTIFFKHREMTATPEGRDALNNKFKFCQRLTKPEDQDKLVGKCFAPFHPWIRS